MAEVWFKNRTEIKFHDPLAAALVFEPDLCRYQSGRAAVLADDTALAGLTHWKPDEADGPHTIAVDVDPDRFFAHYFGVAGG
jgi:purine nucleosidase